MAAALSVLATFSLIAFWYFTNIGVILLNKYLLSYYGFDKPIFLTFMHMAMCTVMGYGAGASGIVQNQSLKSARQALKIAALGLVFCFSLVGGNISLKYLPVSFNQAIGATTPFFTAIFSVLVLRKVETVLTYVALVPVVLGIVLASGGEPQFHAFGFAMCLGATAARALKTTVQELLLANETEKLSSMNLLKFMAPVSALLLLFALPIFEPDAPELAMRLSSGHPGFVGLLLLNAIMAYFVNLSNFLVTKHTSGLTLQVLGNAKGAVAVVVSVILFRNPVTVQGFVGYVVTLCGVGLYSEAQKRASRASSDDKAPGDKIAAGRGAPSPRTLVQVNGV